MTLALHAAAWTSAAIVLLIFGYLVREAWPALLDAGPASFLFGTAWHPTSEPPQYGVAALFVGTLATTLGAVLVAGPLGIAAALCARFFAPPAVGRWFTRFVVLFAGVPSVVFGLWGLTAVAPLVRRIAPPGTSLLTAVIVLALMILPTVALLAGTALERVREEHLRAAAALSLSRASTLTGVVWPSARAGFLVAVVLGTARALGETMAVLMVAGNVVRVPASLFDPVRTLTANIALELGYATQEHRAALFVTGLVLLLLVTVLVLVSRAAGAARA
ncbi:MAG: phosphate ABC transporter permease subunit PstC [Planctomycetota bacterium]